MEVQPHCGYYYFSPPVFGPETSKDILHYKINGLSLIICKNLHLCIYVSAKKGGVKMCTYRQSVRRLVEAECGGQHGGAEREAGAAGIAALAAGATGGIPPALPAQALGLFLDHQDLVVAEVAQQGVVRV